MQAMTISPLLSIPFCVSLFQIAEQSLVGSPNHTMSNPQPLASLLSQQLHTPAMQEPAFHSLESRATYPVSHTAMPIQWPARLSQPRSPPSPFAGSPSPPSVHSLPDHPGTNLADFQIFTLKAYPSYHSRLAQLDS